MTLSNQDLQEIERRCAAARPGPWRSYIEGRDHFGGSNVIVVGDGASLSVDIEPIGATTEDQDFMAAARQDVPRLLAEVRRLRSALERRGGDAST